MSHNDMENADLGDILIDPHGREWKVIGKCNKPTFVLERVKMADVYDHTRQSVVPESPWAANWRRR
jgi:hypothetical protein